MAQPAIAAADCPPGNSTTPVTCTVTADQNGKSQQVDVDYVSTAEGLHDGDSGGDYTVINNASIDATQDPYAAVMVA